METKRYTGDLSYYNYDEATGKTYIPKSIPEEEPEKTIQTIHLTDFEKKEQSLWKKLKEAKKLFRKANVKKTGYNHYQKFKYYELSDIVPISAEIFDKVGIEIQYTLTDHLANMVVRDIDTMAETTYTCPTSTYNGTTNQQIQGVGSVQTYTRRYLYQQVLDIVECDTIDNQDQNKVPTHEEILKLSREIAVEMEEKQISLAPERVKKYITKMKNDKRITSVEYKALLEEVGKVKSK